MFPCLPSEDRTDSGLGDSVSICESHLSPSFSAKLIEFFDAFFSEARVWVINSFVHRRVFAFVSENISGMANVFLRGDQLKVFKSVVALDSVLVVDLHSLRDRSVKSGPESAMSAKGRSLFSRLVHRYATISMSVIGWSNIPYRAYPA